MAPLKSNNIKMKKKFIQENKKKTKNELRYDTLNTHLYNFREV